MRACGWCAPVRVSEVCSCTCICFLAMFHKSSATPGYLMSGTALLLNPHAASPQHLHARPTTGMHRRFCWTNACSTSRSRWCTVLLLARVMTLLCRICHQSSTLASCSSLSRGAWLICARMSRVRPCPPIFTLNDLSPPSCTARNLDHTEHRVS